MPSIPSTIFKEHYCTQAPRYHCFVGSSEWSEWFCICLSFKTTWFRCHHPKVYKEWFDQCWVCINNWMNWVSCAHITKTWSSFWPSYQLSDLPFYVWFWDATASINCWLYSHFVQISVSLFSSFWVVFKFSWHSMLSY